MPAIIDRIVAIKNQILSDLQELKNNNQQIAEKLTQNYSSRSEEIKAGLSELSQAIEEQTGKTNWQLSSAANTLKEIREVMYEYFVPTQDPYSYTAQTTAYRFENPEIALLQHLRSYFPIRNAIDVGAHAGDGCELLLSSGYKVYAFEPNAEVHGQMEERFGGHIDFKSFPIALGAEDGHATLHMVRTSTDVAPNFDKDLTTYGTLIKHALPDGVWFTDPQEVQVRCLKNLHQSRQIPVDIAVVKIDTEGSEIDVIKGMGKTTYPCVVVKFLDMKHQFSQGKTSLLPNITLEMRVRGYNWHIVIYRIAEADGTSDPRYYCNIDQSVENSWGNAIFFRDFSLFMEALKWCTANMRQNETFR